ncbi:hypothetical protein ACFFNY_30120 [Paenibacillus hodogayensis]|uniref:Uncharacterized protein n=1 Tax=Paenibacillus hodogayensis TaxID=279208 RepID=A0ABV5W5J8_9BACL
MRMPSDNELAMLLEGDAERLKTFGQEHGSVLKRYGVNDAQDLLTGDKQEDGNQIRDLFAAVFGVIVDWREEDEEIVLLIGRNLPDETVQAAATDEGLDVTYNGELHRIPLSFSQKDRYMTIRGMNGLIRDKYELRLFEASYFSDTHELLVLPNAKWKSLEERYPEQIKEMFRTIDAELDFP